MICAGASFPEVVEAFALDGAAQGDDGIGASDRPAHAALLEAGAPTMFLQPPSTTPVATHRPIWLLLSVEN